MIVNLVLASGSGSRLYPLSTEERPKQFLKLFDNKMMIEQTLDRFKPYCERSIVVSLKKYEPFLKDLNIDLVLEEEKKDTAISIKTGIEYIRSKYPLDTVVIQSPSDHYIEEEGIQETIAEAVQLAKAGRFVIIASVPSHPDNGFGYVKEDHEKVLFVQKPSEKKAMNLIELGYSWNTAIYVYPLASVVNGYDRTKEDIEGKDFESTVLPHINQMKVVQGRFLWSDIGDFKRLSEVNNKRKGAVE